MTCRLLGCVTLGVLLCTENSDSLTAADKREGTGEETMSLSKTDSPRELADRIRNLFSASPMSDLDALVSSPDCTTALTAAWERARLTVPKVKQHEIVSPNDQALSRFLGLVEGRIQVRIPEGWEVTVKAAKAYGPRAIWFPLLKLVEESLKTHRPTRAGNQWIVKEDSETIKLPAEDGLGPVDNAVTGLGGETVYVALYASSPLPYRLCAIDRRSGKVIWSSKVWADGGLTDYSGQGWHYVEIRLAVETVTVFGVSNGDAYIEVFDSKTGENRCRFSTAYFE